MNPYEHFGEYVFDDKKMSERLKPETYETLRKTTRDGLPLDPRIADEVAAAMKEWALEKGATHYTHWFQPMTGVTAEKHDAFLSPCADGSIQLEFRGKELVHGEADASSLPSGGLRATFEARGYTAWDPSSYAFIKDGVLCIPTAYCSFGGQALDKKTPLLRSMQALNKQALRILRLFGDKKTTRVVPNVGAEQEYFLIDKKMYRSRPDLMVTGRTLFGARPPKGQELDDHFFGAIKPRVQAFMKECNEELWRLGVYCKTEHNETAPSQHEMAAVFTTVNITADHNQLIMEVLKRVADHHDMVCLLHEKPFGGVNGSGKHNNYSLSTDSGVNLFNPGDTPEQNAQFLLFLSAMIAAVDDYQELLRVTVAYAGNDERLGANEAPPYIISIFLGDELSAIIQSIVNEKHYEGLTHAEMKLGVHILPKFAKDTTDRNRTSPFAFTGNKFEFRALGSSQSISGPNVVLNTALADTLQQMADQLEKAQDFTQEVNEVIRTTLRKHSRIIFNGNGYDRAWHEEAARRGLSMLKTTVDALPHYVDQKNIDLFVRQKVYTAQEVESRYEMKLENYVKVMTIEALTMLDMADHLILPASIQYQQKVLEELYRKQQIMDDLPHAAEDFLLRNLAVQTDALSKAKEVLRQALRNSELQQDLLKRAVIIRDSVIPAMHELRLSGDTLETLVGQDDWPMPRYQQLLTSV